MSDVARPEPHPAPEGFVAVAVPEGPDWRVETGRQCRLATRNRRCPNPCVVALNRGRRQYGRGLLDSWWAYCAEHMYGRWIEDGQVMQWIVVPADDPRVSTREVSGG